MRTKVTWFRHPHDGRNELLRFGLMRLHYEGALTYMELPFCEASKYGFSRVITTYPDIRHLSFLLIRINTTTIRCMVDNEDSFALVSPLIKEVDVCFCGGYNSDFFEKKQFVKPYNWQSEQDTSWRSFLQTKEVHSDNSQLVSKGFFISAYAKVTEPGTQDQQDYWS